MVAHICNGFGGAEASPFAVLGAERNGFERGHAVVNQGLIAQAEADGRRRLIEMNEPVRLNLIRIIDGLDALEDDDGR